MIEGEGMKRCGREQRHLETTISGYHTTPRSLSDKAGSFSLSFSLSRSFSILQPLSHFARMEYPFYSSQPIVYCMHEYAPGGVKKGKGMVVVVVGGSPTLPDRGCPPPRPSPPPPPPPPTPSCPTPRLPSPPPGHPCRREGGAAGARVDGRTARAGGGRTLE